MKDIKKTSGLLEALVRTDRRPVGIKFVYSADEYDSYEGTALVKPVSYCMAVKGATRGHSIKMPSAMGGCPGGNRALGLSDDMDVFLSGENGYRMGLYESPEVAASVANSLPYLKERPYGIIIKPFAEFEHEPDVVLVVCCPREAMRILQGYSYTYGLQQHFTMCGNQAVCFESTIIPLSTGEINLSMFCSGTRYKASWDENEVICGIPCCRIEGTVSGLLGTVDAVEEDPRKTEIDAALKSLGINDFKIRYGETYYAKR